MKVYKDIAYNQHCALDIYLPETSGFATFVFFHGGGMSNGDKAVEGIRRLAENFAQKGYGFVSVDYRMYSEQEDTGVRFPEYLEDTAEAVAYVRSHISAYGGSEKIYITGSSAGAWLAAMLCLDKKYLQAVGVENSEIDGWVIHSAQMTSHFNVQKFESGRDPRLQRIDEFAPLYYLNADTAFSKMLLLFYDQDMPCRLEQNMLFYKTVLYLNPNADIEYKLLTGGHCAGQTTLNENGDLIYVAETVDWLNRKGE